MNQDNIIRIVCEDWLLFFEKDDDFIFNYIKWLTDVIYRIYMYNENTWDNFFVKDGFIFPLNEKAFEALSSLYDYANKG